MTLKTYVYLCKKCRAEHEIKSEVPIPENELKSTWRCPTPCHGELVRKFVVGGVIVR